MNRWISFVLGPEVVLIAATAAVFAFCARHPSGEGRDLQAVERLAMLLPFVLVPLVFATVLVPGARNWGWLARTLVFTFVALGVCAGRTLSAFGTGAKGQDAGFIMILTLGVLLASLGTAAAGALILAETRPTFAAWFRAHPVLGVLLTLLSTVPIGLALGVVLTGCLAVILGVWAGLSR